MRIRVLRLLAVVLLVFGIARSVSSMQQTAPAVRPPLLFREDWRLPKHAGAATDENMRFTPEVVTNERLEVKLYGAGSAPVRAAEHEGRIDLWTGLATSPVALTLRTNPTISTCPALRGCAGSCAPTRSTRFIPS